MTENEALDIVTKELTIEENGIIRCTDEQWSVLSPEAKSAVYYLVDEWDFDVRG